VDNFFIQAALNLPTTKNVELCGRDGMKVFRHGIAAFMRPKIRRINGGWWIAIARQLRIFLCCTDLICDDTRQQLSEALHMLLKVHHAVRYPILKSALNEYEDSIKDVLTAMIGICEGHTPSGCHSIKYHWPLHWWITRREFGCSADEKSLERMLGEAQKLHFKHTNSRYNIEVKLMHKIMDLIISH
jgi:hypothetical protein